MAISRLTGQIDLVRTGLIISGGLCGAVVGYLHYSGALVDQSGNLIDLELSSLVATIFSVLAGFLSVALNLVVIARPVSFKSKKSQRDYTKLIARRLRRHNWLFFSYITILCCVFFAEVSKRTYPMTGNWFETLYLGLSASALIWSFMVPSTIAQIHDEASRFADNAGQAAP